MAGRKRKNDGACIPGFEDLVDKRLVSPSQDMTQKGAFGGVDDPSVLVQLKSDKCQYSPAKNRKAKARPRYNLQHEDLKPHVQKAEAYVKETWPHTAALTKPDAADEYLRKKPRKSKEYYQLATVTAFAMSHGWSGDQHQDAMKIVLGRAIEEIWGRYRREARWDEIRAAAVLYADPAGNSQPTLFDFKDSVSNKSPEKQELVNLAGQRSFYEDIGESIGRSKTYARDRVVELADELRQD